MFKIDDPNVDIPDDQMREVIRMVLDNKSGADIFRAGIKTSKGEPISERQARRYRVAAKRIIQELDPKMMDNYLGSQGYMPDLVIAQDEETYYPPVIVPKTNNRSAVMDIEVMSPAFGNMGKFSSFLVCVCFYPFDGDPYTLNLEFSDRRDDRRLLWEVLNEMSKYTFIIGHNVKGYDINWLLTRAMFYGWDIPKRLFYYDTLSAAKRIPILHRKSLGRLIDFFRIEGAEKTQIWPLKWDRISSPAQGDFDAAIEEISYHCIQDVTSNKEVYNILMQYDPRPSWNLWPK
jgi:DNA polymerase elongation subunit (family B)